jgi:hypothetical protein
MDDATYIAALRRERTALEQYGKTERVMAVIDELRRLGALPPETAPAQVETATATVPVARRIGHK